MVAGTLSALPPIAPSLVTVSADARAGSTRAGVQDESGLQTDAAESVQGLDGAELKELQALKARDREVRAHETAHQAVGGQHAGAISYVFKQGPDGAQYAVGGEVPIDVSPVNGDPQATIEKMQVVRAAALAPAEPSSQDRAVAAEAMQQMLKAQVALARERQTGESDENRGDASASEADAGRQSRVMADAYQSVFAVNPNQNSLHVVA